MLESKKVPEKIIDILNEKGPSLPIQLAKQIGISSLFISAYLSELAGEKRIKVSHLRVGGSPLYFLEGQVGQLEEFYKFLHPKEAEAFILLKKNKILKDSEQEPAIRVALRSIRDFAIGFKKNDEIYWKYFSVTDSEIEVILDSQKISKPEKIEPSKVIEIKKIPERIEPQKPIEVKSLPEKEARKKQTSEIFLEEVKFYLKQRSIELVNLEAYDKKELIAKIRFNLTPERVHLLFAYNKKKITDKDLLKSYKKSLKYQIDYLVLFKGELSKRLKDTIKAHKNLISTDKLGV